MKKKNKKKGLFDRLQDADMSVLIIRIAVVVSALAAVSSVVTLIRAYKIGLSPTFPIIQTVGSIAIFAVCFLMLRSLSADDEDEDEEDGTADEEAAEEASDEEPDEEPEAGKTERDGDKEDEKIVDELTEKYNLKSFEE